MTLHELFFRFPKEFPLPFILDGATGTSLMKLGMPKGVCTEKWVEEHPEAIKTIQRGYLEAGSNAVYAPTFGANAPSLKKHGITDIKGTNARLASLSTSLVCRCGGLVAGDMSPTGRMLEPFGDASFEEIVEVYRVQAEALEGANIDFFVIETSISLAEVRAAVTGVREVSSRPIFVTMTVDANGRTMSGDTLEACLVTLAPLGINAFGTNCSTGPREMLGALKPLLPLALAYGIALIAKPNAGIPHEDECGQTHFDLSAADFAAYAPEFLSSGIFVLGGCCGTDADYIKALRASVDTAKIDLDSLAGIAKPDPDSLAATSRTVAEVDLDALGEEDFHPCDDELPDYDGEDDCLCVRLEGEEDAELLRELTPTILSPLVLAGDEGAIRDFMRDYAGRPLLKNL